MGVNVVGYTRDHTGLGEIARLLIAALEHGGIPHTVIAAGRRTLRERLRQPEAQYDTNLVCVNAELLPGLVETVGHSFFKDRRTIGFWWWEVERFPAVMGWAAHLVDEIWVGSDHVRQAIEADVSKPVHTFPVPVIRPRVAHLTRREIGIPEERFAFAFSFNFVSVFERKNPLGLLDAFSRAFAPDEGPILVVKTVNGGKFPGELARLRAAAAARPDVFIIDRSLAPAQYHGLIAACDAYASLHRAEGFGLTIAEAMALGKPAVATGYSGNLEFMNEGNSYLIPSELVPIPAGLEPYTAGGRWADPDLDSAAAALRRVVAEPDDARSKAGTALGELERGHSFENAAAFVSERLSDDSHRLPAVPLDLVDRAAYELMWGPDLETARPWARRLRQVIRPFLRPYVDHQRRVGALVLEALRERERVVEQESPSQAGHGSSGANPPR
jgi:glycosyltransferase involved in cell wall biosynthesis